MWRTQGATGNVGRVDIAASAFLSAIGMTAFEAAILAKYGFLPPVD